MKGTPLMDTQDPKLVARGYNLGLRIAANVATSLTREELEYWEQNLGQLQLGLRTGFGLAKPDQADPPPPSSRPSFAFAATNAAQALKEAEAFAEQFFGHRRDLHLHFVMPETLLWKEVIAVYDPGTLNNRMAVDQALKAQSKLKNVYEERDLMDYKDAKASGKPTLRFIERSEKPTADLMGLSADEMVATKRPLLDQRGYIIAFGTYHKATDCFLDRETWTRFPTSRLPDGKVALGYWYPGRSQVYFNWNGAASRHSRFGGREAVECDLATL